MVGKLMLIIHVFDLFAIGIGPSSSHTVGPMRAVTQFMLQLAANLLATRVTGVNVTLKGCRSMRWPAGSERTPTPGFLSELGGSTKYERKQRFLK
jgi:L-serine dehydratase